MIIQNKDTKLNNKKKKEKVYTHQGCRNNLSKQNEINRVKKKVFIKQLLPYNLLQLGG